MAELRQHALDQLRTDMAACLAAIRLLEERAKGMQDLMADVRHCQHRMITLEGQLHRLVEDLEQLEHVVRIPNGTEPLTYQMQAHAHTLNELQTWKAKHEPLIIALESSRIQAQSAVQVAQVQGASARMVALLSLSSAVLAALITGLLLWWSQPATPAVPPLIPPPATVQPAPGKR